MKSPKLQDSPEYLARRAAFDRMLTLYGRKAVLEALQDPSITPAKLHLSRNNRAADILSEITEWAQKRGVETMVHEPAALARISKNAKQDQGVALDIRCAEQRTLDEFLSENPKRFRLIALDGLTNPQNIGMIIRSVAASPYNGLLMCTDTTPRINPLMIKASAGALFRAPILRGAKLEEALGKLAKSGAEICILDSNGSVPLQALPPADRRVFVLGNETVGVSACTRKLATRRVAIPMQRGVESLNVAICAALVAFSGT